VNRDIEVNYQPLTTRSVPSVRPRTFSINLIAFRVGLCWFVVNSLFCLLSCGLEEYLFIDYIPDSYKNDYTSAIISLPSRSTEGYSNIFSHFEIFYRIYISAAPPGGLINTSTLMSNVNSALNSDYQGLYYLTNKTGTASNPSNLETTFSSRKYFKLTLENNNIDNVLGSGSLGGKLEISFETTSGVKPVLNLNGIPYTIFRANSGPGLNFTPSPNRYFLNHPYLYDPNNVSKLINEDVAAPNANTIPRYTYVSMYIFAIGRDYITTIYSQPTHINIFCLPDA